MVNRLSLQALTAITIIIGAAGSAAAQTRHIYRVDYLGSLGGDLVGVAINNRGDVTGTAVMADGTQHAFRWTVERGLEDLGTNGGRKSEGFAINDRGDVAGAYFDQNWSAHAFIARPGEAMQDLGAIYPQIVHPTSLTNDGRMAGSSFSGHAFRTLVDGTFQELSTYLSAATDMNDAGDVAGYGWHDADSMTHPETAFRYSDLKGYEDLGTLGGPHSNGHGINEEGVVVGTSELVPGFVGHAFRAKPGSLMEDLGGLAGGFAGGVSTAWAINKTGDIVGQSDAPYGWAAFVYSDDEGMIDLKARISIVDRLSGPLNMARDINNIGQIIVTYNSLTTEVKTLTMLLTPIESAPAPTAAPIASPSALTPPDGRMVPVVVYPYVTDLYDPEPVCRIVNVTNSEGPVTGPDPDVEITGALSVNLRAKRLGYNIGRTYTLALTCSNYFGQTSTATVVVRVPHDSSNQ
jgi:probable HAF family extracellular repeat protein